MNDYPPLSDYPDSERSPSPQGDMNSSPSPSDGSLPNWRGPSQQGDMNGYSASADALPVNLPTIDVNTAVTRRVQDYQMELMLLEAQNKRRLKMQSI